MRPSFAFEEKDINERCGLRCFRALCNGLRRNDGDRANYTGRKNIMYDLGRQIAQRFSLWKEELKRHLYTPVGTVDFTFFSSPDTLTPGEAAARPACPAPAGTKWGGMWEYGWFFGKVTLPAACEGKRTVLFSRVGGEQLVYANGRAIGSIDKGHAYITLSREAKAGETFILQIESYAGHGPRLEALGPCPPERPAIPPVSGPQCTVEESVIAIWNEDAYQLMLDVEALDQLQQVLPDKSLRALKVAEALDQFTRIADFELPHARREESFRRAREALREALSCVNGSTAPTMWMFGQSHIDLGWLWPLEETYHKSVRTYSTQLALMEEYPEYRFLLCEPALLDMLMERDKEVWERVKEAFRQGQIEPEGAFYVECDTNMPSGESLIRQLMYGKEWFRQQFGRDALVAWQPDTFGYSAVLPQIFKKLGIRYFATEKLLRADPETQRFPYQNFIWEGMDGSCVEALSFFKANAPVNPQLLHKRWEADRSQLRNIDTMLYSFGYGDGGGGADRDMLEMIRRLRDLEGAPRARWGTLRGFFEETSRQAQKNRWTGELYLAWHRGTYSVQRRQKEAMRRAENALREAEALLSQLPEEWEEWREPLKKSWKTLMINQFHDIAGGVGIARVHKEAEEALRGICEKWQPVCDGWRRKVYGIENGNGYVFVNSLPWTRNGWAALPDGREIFVSVPPMGAVSASDAEETPKDRVRALETGEGYVIQNGCLRAVIDRRGRITGLTDLQSGLEMLSDKQVMNDWRLYKNVQTVYDAWEMDREWQSGYMPDAVQGKAQLTKQTEFCAEITVNYSFGNSAARQIIRLRAGEPQVEFETEADWHERRKMLKVHFESNILCDDAIHEIQFGHVKRPCHRSHPFAADRYEVSNHRFSALCEGNRGFALLNNGLYGLSTGRGEMALTLLRAPLVPDDTCDRGLHRFAYALRLIQGPFRSSQVVRAGYEFNVPLSVLPGSCQRQTGLHMNEESGVILETVKPAEDGKGVILRLYESLGETEEAVLCLPGEGELFLSSMDEREEAFLEKSDKIKLLLHPFEIQTLRVRF